MSNHFVLSNSVLGGVYSSKNRTYTFFLPGGCCVVPENDLQCVESYEKFKASPEDFIYEVMMHGLNTKISAKDKPIDNEIMNNKYLKLD